MAALLAAAVAGCAKDAGERAADRGPGFVAPAGCEHLATVQRRSCGVGHVLACGPGPADRTVHAFRDGDPEAVLTAASGLFPTRMRTTRGTTMLIDYTVASIAADEATGLVSASAAGLVSRPGSAAFARVEGDYVTRRVTEIDGRRVLALRLAATVRPFEGLGGGFTDTVHYDPALGAAIGGVSSGVDDTPVAIALPGDPGFASNDPITPCGPA